MVCHYRTGWVTSKLRRSQMWVPVAHLGQVTLTHGTPPAVRGEEVTSCCRAQRNLSASLTCCLKNFAAYGCLDPRCCRETAEVCPTLWILSPKVFSCGQQWEYLESSHGDCRALGAWVVSVLRLKGESWYCMPTIVCRGDARNRV